MYKPLKVVANGDTIELEHYNTIIENVKFLDGSISGGGTTPTAPETNDIVLTYSNRSTWPLQHEDSGQQIAFPIYFDQKMRVDAIVIYVARDANRPARSFDKLKDGGSGTQSPSTTSNQTYYTATTFSTSGGVNVEAGDVWWVQPSGSFGFAQYGISMTIRGEKINGS